MNILKVSTLLLVLFMLACGNNTNKKQEVVNEVSEVSKNVEANIVTFDLSDSTINHTIGNRTMGKAKSGEKLSDKFAIRNVTDKAVVILSVKSNCGCLQVEYEKSPIKAGEKKIMDYSYDTSGKMGQQFSEVTIKTNIGNYIVLVDLQVE